MLLKKTANLPLTHVARRNYQNVSIALGTSVERDQMDGSVTLLTNKD
jgi:hypothetical protein